MMNIRDFQRGMKVVIAEIEQGHAFIILRNGRPVFKVSPIVSETLKIENVKLLKSTEPHSKNDLITL